MGEDKKQLTKLLAFVERLYKNPDNKEFAAGIESMVKNDTKSVIGDTCKIDEIYELCLEKNAKEQAKGVYAEFPLPDITNTLIEDYVVMERFRRRGDFHNYCAQLFLQIENICNAICADKQYQEIYTNLLHANISPFFDSKGANINDRYSPPKATYKPDITINKVVFWGHEKTFDGKEKKDMLPSQLDMQDRVRYTLYSAGFGSKLTYPNYFGEWNYNTNLIYDIYLIRCQADHRGGIKELTDKNKERIANVLSEKNRYYALFFCGLIYFVNKIIEGNKLKDELITYARTIREHVEECTVSSILPSTLFVKSVSGETHEIPIKICKDPQKFKEGQKIKAFFNDMNKIVKIDY